MSESDDTDLLLQIPPTVFNLPSDSDLDSPTIVEDLISQVNIIESRLSLIEFREESMIKEGECDGEIEGRKNRAKVLGEIDSYLESSRGLKPDGDVRRLGLPEVDKLLKEMEATQLDIESKLRAKEIEYGLNKDEDGGRRQFSSADFGRDLYAVPLSLKNPPNTPPKPGERDAFLVGSSVNSDAARRSSTSSVNSHSPMRDFQRSSRPKNYLSPRRRLQIPSEASAIDWPGGRGDSKSEPSLKTMRPNLLSLSELWKNEDSSETPNSLRKKLEEEKLRRLHLENTVQALNRRVLEEQEKVAVAMNVDEEKDKAIGLITEAWRQMVGHWKEIESERHALSQRIIEEKSAIKRAQESVDKKIERWEKEVAQALDLAAGYKSKCEFLESELNMTKDVSESRIRELEDVLHSKERQVEELLNERTQLKEKLSTSEEDHEEVPLNEILELRLSQVKGVEKKLVEVARREVEIVQENLSKLEAELAIVKEQKESVTTRLKEEQSRNSVLDAQRKNLQELLAETQIQHKKAEEEAKAAISKLERSRSELKALYQHQLEDVVKEKLTEFQSQLEEAKSAMEAEVEATRKTAIERAEQHQQALVNSHLLEKRRLEAIHKEEIRCLQRKLMETERRLSKLENGKKDIAQKLHGVMETQWQQALNIITSELSMRQVEPDFEKQQYPVKQTESEGSDDTPFNKDGQLTCRSNSERSNIPGKQDQLLRYIQMLLHKPPGKMSESWQDSTQSERLDQTQPDMDWPQHEAIPNPPMTLGGPQSRKPPWK